MIFSKGMGLTGPRAILVGVVMVAASAAHGGVILPGPEGLAIFAGGQINAQGFASIDGSIGAVGSIWLGTHSDVAGDLLTTGSVSTGLSVDISGDLVVSGTTYLGGFSGVAGSVRSAGSFGTGSRVTVTGDVLTEGSLDLGSRSTITGQGQYVTGYSLGSHASVHGGLSTLIDAIDTWSPGNLGDLTLISAGSGSITKAGGSVSDLDPGAYGALSLGSGATINLSAGSYSFISLDLDDSAALNVNTFGGDVVIYVQQDVLAGSGFEVNAIGAGSVSFVVGGGIDLGANSDIDASLVSLGSDITLANSVSVAGQLWAQGNVNLGFHANVDGRMSVAVSLPQAATIPEPAAIVMIGAGLCIVTRRTVRHQLAHAIRSRPARAGGVAQ